jgi:molybdopterin synthase sulfur carrier subunit
LKLACTVLIPAPLRSYSGGLDSIELHGATLREVLEDMAERHGALYGRVCGATGEVLGHVNVYLNEVDVRKFGGLDAPVAAGDEILLVPAIAGG